MIDQNERDRVKMNLMNIYNLGKMTKLMKVDLKEKRLLLVAGLIATFIGCQVDRQQNSSDLEVSVKIDTIRGGHEGNNYCWVSFNVDIPINGPQVLVDSVMALVNGEVYKMCEYSIEFVNRLDENVAYSEKEMFTNDGKRLLRHYMDKYKSLIEDSLWNTFGLDMKLEAQTEKYVTYGVENYYCGANCSSEKHFYTFDKSDGHLVKEIISGESLVRFFSDNSEYNHLRVNPLSGEFGSKITTDYEVSNSDCGLLDNHLSLVFQIDRNFELENIPYHQIFPYLSPEVQNLVEQNKSSQVSR